MEKSLSEYIGLSKNIDNSNYSKKLKVALLSSFTLNGLNEILHVKCSDMGVRYQSYISGYNQYNQELLNPESDYYKFCPDITFLILDIRNFLGDNFYNFHILSDDTKKEFVKEKINHLENIIQNFEKNSNSKLIITLTIFTIHLI